MFSCPAESCSVRLYLVSENRRLNPKSCVSGGISVGREQRLVALTVVIEAQRDVTAHRVVCAERGFDALLPLVASDSEVWMLRVMAS